MNRNLSLFSLLFIFLLVIFASLGCIDKKIPDQDEVNTTNGSNDYVQVHTDYKDGDWVKWTIDDNDNGAVKLIIHDGGFSGYPIGNLSVGVHKVHAYDGQESVTWTVNVQAPSKEQVQQGDINTGTSNTQYGYTSWDEQNRIANQKKANSTPVI